MSNDKKRTTPESKAPAGELDRRAFLAATTGLAAMTAGCATAGSSGSGVAVKRPNANTPTAPFDSIRDWMQAMDDHGLLMRIPEVDQDKFEATGLFFRMTDYYGKYGSPALIFDRVKIDGEWIEGPVMANTQGHWSADNIMFGMEPEPLEWYTNYLAVKDEMHKVLDANGGRFPQIAPNELSRAAAPCKEITLEGDDIDLTKFAFMQTNPYDDGRYVNSASVFTTDPKMGPNYGTYRCALRGPRKLAFNPEPNQTANRMMAAAIKRGEKSAPIALVIGQDPMVWMISGTKVALRFGPKPIDELALAGGFRGKAMDVVKCDTNDMMVPAHCEMVIEGIVPLDDESMEPEGPFGEMFGYMGAKKESNFIINVTRVTHRPKPWMMNAFTGMQRGMVTAPQDALYESFLKRGIPNIVQFQTPQYCMGVIFMSIDKQAAGEGIKAGQSIAKTNPIAKIIIVVDKDVNILNPVEMLAAMGARWQPYPASEIVEKAPGLFTDPSQVVYAQTSKIIIDATRQFPEEGGMPREDYPLTNREHLTLGAPEVWEDVEGKFVEMIKKWEQV